MALFNNSFPATYQPYYQQQYQPVAMPAQNHSPQQQGGGIIWVQGEAGAKSYLVAPNTTVQLWDSENQVIYIKSADASGMPSIKTLEYTIRDAESPSKAFNADGDKYVLKDEIKRLEGDIEALRADLDKLKHARKKKVEAEDYE